MIQACRAAACVGVENPYPIVARAYSISVVSAPLGRRLSWLWITVTIWGNFNSANPSVEA